MEISILTNLTMLDLENAEESDNPDSDAGDEEIEFTHSDALGKVLALVKQVDVCILMCYKP